MPQSPLQECLIAQPKPSQEISPRSNSRHRAEKSSSTNSTTFPPTVHKKLTPPAVLGRFLVTKLQTLTHFGRTTVIQVNLLKAREAKLSCTPKESSLVEGDFSLAGRNPIRDKKALLRALLMTGAIAASAGLGFGFALRVNGPQGPGSSFLHTEQSFPSRADWPVSKPRL